MDLIDASLIFVTAHLCGMLLAVTPISDWIKVIVFVLYLGVPSWYAWYTGLWPFYIITGVLSLVFICIIAYTLGKAVSDAKD